MDTESWKAVVGCDGRYEVSSMGRVRRLSFIAKNGRRCAEKILSAKPSKATGYVMHFCEIDGVRTNLYAHRLVAEAFIANPEGLPEVNHIDGDRGNNGVTNLEWVTHQQNLDHAAVVLGRGFRQNLRNGKGEVSAASKLTERHVVEIKRLLSHGVKQRDIARRFNTPQTNISSINTGKTWAHVTSEQ